MREPEWWDTLNYESLSMNRFELVQTTLEAEARITRTRAEHGLYPRRHAKRDLKRFEQERARLEGSRLAADVRGPN
jgi:hypothetical protein